MGTMQWALTALVSVWQGRGPDTMHACMHSGQPAQAHTWRGGYLDAIVVVGEHVHVSISAAVLGQLRRRRGVVYQPIALHDAVVLLLQQPLVAEPLIDEG